MDKSTITAITAVAAGLVGAWNSYSAPAKADVAPVAARVEALGVDVEWLKWQGRQSGCAAQPQDESGPPANLAPLPRLGR